MLETYIDGDGRIKGRVEDSGSLRIIQNNNYYKYQ